MSARFGVFGKHPAFGDFLSHGFSRDIADGLGAWLDKALTSLREDMGEGWQEFWDTAQPLRFWMGAEVLGQPLAGLIEPSRDKVGRRYPLILAAESSDQPLPVLDTDQSFYEALEAHIHNVIPVSGGASLLDGLMYTLGEATILPASIWAHHPDANLPALLTSAAQVDHIRAAARRSHFWNSGSETRAAVWHAGDGLPDSEALGWLLTGVATAPDAEDTSAPVEEESVFDD